MRAAMNQWVRVLLCPGCSARFSLHRLRIQPQLHARFQHAEWHGAMVKHGIMKFAHIESCTKFLFGFRTQFANLHLSDLIGKRLARPNDVAIHFDSDVLIGLAGVLTEEIDRLLPRPAYGIHSGIHDQPYRSPHFLAELSELRLRIFVQAKLFAETLGIKPPTLDECRVAGVLSEFRN